MKKVFGILLIVAILFFVYQNSSVLASNVGGLFYNSPCATPKAYSIGTIDPRFNITEADFISAAQEADSLWKNADGEPLFVYDPEANLTISLIYDERQYLNNQIDDLNNQVEERKDTLKPEIADYENRAAEFKRRNAALNERISYYNNQGGAPEEEYNKLLSEQRSLQQEAKELQAMAGTLNQSTDQYNTQIQALDQKVDSYNDTLETKPEEGIYIREGRNEKIIIYFNNSRPELVHTLAHELGHAISMPHIDNETSIMYPKTTEVVSLSSEDVAALAEVCREQSILKTAGENIALLASDIRSFAVNAMNRN